MTDRVVDPERPCTVAFVAYGGGHVNMIVPVMQALQARGDCAVHALGLTTAGEVLRRAGLPSIGFRDLVRPGDEPALEWGRKHAAGLSGGRVPIEESIAYLGLSYAELERQWGVDEARARFDRLGRQAFLPIETLERWLTELAPDLVVATNSPRAERAAIVAAGRLGIPAICLVDLFALKEVEWVGQPGYADRVCVLAEFVRATMVGAGRRPDEVIVTGSPVFDRLAATRKLDRRELRRGRGWADGDRAILFASQPEPERHPFSGAVGDPSLPRRIDGALMELVAVHPDWRLVIRPHPSESLELGALPGRVELSGPDDDLAKLLHAADVVVTMTSTVGIEAAILGRPLVVVEMSVFTPDAPYVEMGLGRGVTSLGDLEQALVAALAPDFSTGGEIPAAGGATARVVAVIDELLGVRRRRVRETPR